MLFKSRLKYYIFLLIIFFSWSNLSYASLEISEIMYSPESGSDYEWVEIYNNSSDAIDLNKYRFFHGENSGPITLKSGDSAILQPLKYFIVAKSLADYSWLDFSDMVFSSSVLSLPDSGDNTYIAISDPNKIIIDDVTYDVSNGGSKASKSSLSKIDGEWVSGIPTPGKDNKNIISLNNSEEIKDNTNETNSVVNSKNLSSNTDQKELEVFKITTKIISPKIVLAGIPFSFSSITTTNKGETYTVGRYVWNFGDGMLVEAKEDGPFEYTYEYPGEYSLTLSYFDSYFSKQPDATNKTIIKVVLSEIYISSVGDDINPFVEIENKSNYDVNFSNWIITAGAYYFNIPTGTTLLSNKKIKFSPKITGFTKEDIKSVVLMNSNKEIISSYPLETKKPIQQNIKSKNLTNKDSAVLNKIQNEPLFKDSQIINLNDLVADSSGSGVEIPKSVYSFVGLIIIIIMGIAAFLLIKRKDKTEDYEDKEIRPEDMTIIE